MIDIAIPVIVLSARHDDVEFFNKTLRDAGHAVRCRAVARVEDLEETLEADPPHLLVQFSEGCAASVETIAQISQVHAPLTPFVVIAPQADEQAMSAAMDAGAHDLISVEHRGRIAAVCARELKAYRSAHSLQDALHTAMQYKKQLKSLLSNSADAIAVIQEGIVVEANQAWADLFTDSDIDAALGPLMDQFAPASHASLKSALTACYRGRQERTSLSLEGLRAGSESFPASLMLEATTHDGEPAVHVSIERERPAMEATAPEVIVEQTLHTDLATGFLQRRQFLELLSEKIEHGSQRRARVLAFIRPDMFEQIERDLGPVSSEEIVGQIAEVLDKMMDESDLGGRYAGEILALVIERDNLRDAETWAEYALTRIRERLFEVSDRSLSLTCSLGLAEIGTGTDRVEDLIRGAERALARASEQGGNRVVLEETSDESTRIKRIDEIRIRQIKAALLDGRFRLMHLSIASLAGKAERLFDTFVRLVDEQGDEVAAADFMESASRNGMLRPVDRWVIEATLDFCKRQASDLVFVKLSHESLLDTSLWSWIEERTAKAEIKPGRLCFQVTEDDASKFQKQTHALAAGLRRRGYRFAVEGFGTGRDPLRILSSVPMDFLKFDGSLTRKLSQDSAVQEKMRSFVSTATQRGVRTIATHVENANTMTLLFQLGVAYMQGHYLHEPEVVLEAVV